MFGCFSFDTGSHVAQDNLTFPLLLLPSLSCALRVLCCHNWLRFWDIAVTWVALCFLGLGLPSGLSTQAHGRLLRHSSFSLVPIKTQLSGIIFLQLDINLRLPWELSCLSLEQSFLLHSLDPKPCLSGNIFDTHSFHLHALGSFYSHSGLCWVIWKLYCSLHSHSVPMASYLSAPWKLKRTSAEPRFSFSLLFWAHPLM